MKENKGNGLIVIIIGVALIIAGFVVTLYSFVVTREQAVNSDILGMVGTFGFGLIIGIILVVVGILILFFGLRSG